MLLAISAQKIPVIWGWDFGVLSRKDTTQTTNTLTSLYSISSAGKRSRGGRLFIKL
jgi:hypothetical protein